MIGTRRRRAGRRSRRWKGRWLIAHWLVMLTGTNYYSARVLLQDMSPGNIETYVALVERSTLLNMTWRSMH